MPKTEVKLNYTKFNKANSKLLLAFADYILKSLKNQGKVYNEQKYGSIKNMKRWNKPKLVKWLLQFNVTLKSKPK